MAPTTKTERRRALRRAAHRELEAARTLGTNRVHRRRGESAGDVEIVKLPCGRRMSVEVKTRGKRNAPKLVRNALAQARRYGLPGDVPAAVVSVTGGAPLVVLPLRAFAEIASLRPSASSAQGVLAIGGATLIEALLERAEKGASSRER